MSILHLVQFRPKRSAVTQNRGGIWKDNFFHQILDVFKNPRVQMKDILHGQLVTMTTHQTKRGYTRCQMFGWRCSYCEPWRQYFQSSCQWFRAPIAGVQIVVRRLKSLCRLRNLVWAGLVCSLKGANTDMQWSPLLLINQRKRRAFQEAISGLFPHPFQ